MLAILDSLPRTAAAIAIGGVALIGISLSFGTGSFAALFTAWSGSLAGFACTMLALVMFSRGMRRSLRTRSSPAATAPAPRQLALPAPTISRTHV